MRQLESIAKKAVWASLVLCSAMLWTEPVMAAKPQPVRQVLWYTRPATNWMTEALPVGNGRIGAMIFGGLPSNGFSSTTKRSGPAVPPNAAHTRISAIFLLISGLPEGIIPGVLSITAGSWILTMRWPRSFIRRMA